MRNDFCSNYLAHSAKGTGWQNHKYIAKVRLSNNKWFYFYSQKAYDAYLRRKNNGLSNDGRFAKKNPNEDVENALKDGPLTGAKIEKKTIAQKKKETAVAIVTGRKVSESLKKSVEESKDKSKLSEAGKKKSEEIIKKAKESGSDNEKKSSSKKSGSSSSKKSSGSSSSKKSGSSSGKKSSGSSESKTSSSGSSSKKATETTKAQSSSTKSDAKIATNSKVNNTPITMDTLKKVYGKKDSDVKDFSGTAEEFKKEMLSKYDEGDFGYLSAGDTVYKWVIENGELILQDYDTEKEVSYDDYLKDTKEFKEFKSNKYKR